VSERAIQQASRWPGTWTLVRDILTWGLGAWLAISEAQRPEAREGILILCGSLLVTPAAAVGAVAAAGFISQRRAGTPEPPSSPQPGAVSP